MTPLQDIFLFDLVFFNAIKRTYDTKITNKKELKLLVSIIL